MDVNAKQLRSLVGVVQLLAQSGGGEGVHEHTAKHSITHPRNLVYFKNLIRVRYYKMRD